MPTSLRKQLQNDYMPPRQVISIGLDVARALNYLHLMQPDPIIHRNISSTNVLLEPITCNKWRAKVSDYGSVNLLQQLQTECPGNPAYSAPEANKPRQQSPKMDIYSFGALLLEMLTGELPIREERGRLIHLIHHRPLLASHQKLVIEQLRSLPVSRNDFPLFYAKDSYTISRSVIACLITHANHLDYEKGSHFATLALIFLLKESETVAMEVHGQGCWGHALRYGPLHLPCSDAQ